MNTQLTHNRRTKLTFAGVIALLGASLALMASAWGGSPADAHGTHGTHVAPAAVKKAKKANRANRLNQAKVRRAYLRQRSLWYEHMEWTYATVTAFVSDSPGLAPTMQRLLNNQKHIGNSIRPYYGKAAANRLTALLTEHIELAVPVLVAARDGNESALNTAVADWYDNASRVGKFLAAANPAWKDGEEMLEHHIDSTIAYSVDQLEGNYAKSIRDYNAAEKHMVMLGNQIARGLVKAFPNKFR